MIDPEKLNLVYQPHTALETPTKTFESDDVEYKQRIADKMYELMRQHKGIGLAANQVALDASMFVMQTVGNRMDVFNPTILKASDKKVLMLEGCLSDPGLYLKVQRPAEITVKYEDAEGTVYEEDLYGIEARCFLHEFDHLSGIVFTDRVGRTKLNMANKKRFKLLKSFKK